MKDKDFEMMNQPIGYKDSDGSYKVTDFRPNRFQYSKEDLEKAYQAGFDFEEASFDEWYDKTYKNGTG